MGDYRIDGSDALRQKNKGQGRTRDKSKTTPLDIPDVSNNNEKYIKQLEDEFLKLKIEKAYLKELRRLRLEGTPHNKK